LWSSPPALPLRLAFPRTTFALTDFRLVVRRQGETVEELALDDIESVALAQSWYQRASGTSTVRVVSRGGTRALSLANIREGPQIALLLQLRAAEFLTDEPGDVDAGFFRRALEPKARLLRPRPLGMLIAATLAFALLFVGVGLARHEPPAPVAYAADDPIAPLGKRRSTEEIAAFMEREVMPFARRALGPVVGAAEEVTCETCHGPHADARGWRMPGVRALPEPEVRFAGLERARLWLDPQIRNAVYGYLAEEGKQGIAAYMRREVLPGMAAVLRRPAYDFAKSYGHNRSQAAVGCYHCHLVE
jgi:hypothetical protein